MADLSRVWKLLSAGELSAGPEPGTPGSRGWLCHQRPLSRSSPWLENGVHGSTTLTSSVLTPVMEREAKGFSEGETPALTPCLAWHRPLGPPPRHWFFSRAVVPTGWGCGSAAGWVCPRAGEIPRGCWPHCLQPFSLQPLQDLCDRRLTVI